MIQGNFIGTNAAGTTAIGAAFSSIGIDGNSIDTIIGGMSAAARNVIAPGSFNGGDHDGHYYRLQ